MEDDLCSLISSNQDVNISENTANSDEDQNFKTFTVYSESESTSEVYRTKTDLKKENINSNREVNISYEVKKTNGVTLSRNKESDEEKQKNENINNIHQPYSQHTQYRHLHNPPINTEQLNFQNGKKSAVVTNNQILSIGNINQDKSASFKDKNHEEPTNKIHTEV